MRAINFAPIPELVQCLYRQARLGSPLAGHLLHSPGDREALYQALPFGVLLESMEWEDRKNLRQVLVTLGLRGLNNKKITEVIEEIVVKLADPSAE
ncbi:hypothetical protein [Desulfoferrobacter suflitae]|uniref:hypothetical protein n=1 Tax=Desulfoferrobacter suflitae TaxID=2865782 RepID=UPI002164360B|nr:hypothetical protein [Desulfoferrobacter suflitae]MCK8603661.1 hypothetical protein [Desulfoferrobacter suflitae]